ncbi:hypothetical protein ACFO26_01695 [Lactococcus nasutitermitis]|uniref:Uncharacterized protein n=1 Tax=Lactococcus nasutitermitis TaxID=1652957 RepID=A0ABV9JCA7_9LACT|nr:hypothetical protein [Lactococcus nasutitermitis]
MDYKKMEEDIEIYYSSVENEENGRYRSWNIIFDDFSMIDTPHLSNEKLDYLTRSLMLYLANFGMLRGSSKLLKHNYHIHEEAVEIVIESLPRLRQYPENEKEIKGYAEKVWETIDALQKYYRKIDVSPTATLISKIILGTSAAIPAYDTYFKNFLRENRLTQKLGKQSIREIWDLWFVFKANSSDLPDYPYPPMKLIDMTGFQFGNSNSKEKKA